MGTYLIRAVKIEDGEVTAAHVCGIGAVPGRANTFALADGEILDRAKLASLAIYEDVRVATIPAVGEFGIGSRVRRKPGQMEYLTSVDVDDKPNDDLINLPKLE